MSKRGAKNNFSKSSKKAGKSRARGVSSAPRKDKGLGLGLDGVLRNSSSFSTHLLALAVLAILALLVYSNSFSVPFHFDDNASIVNSDKIKSLANFWPPSGSRYLGELSFALNYSLSGLELFGFHLFNLFIHICSAFLIFSLTLLIFETPRMKSSSVDAGEDNPVRNRLFALCVAMLFVAHPVNTQAVTYIVQRFASLATLFYLLTIVLYLKARLSIALKGRADGRAVIYVVSAAFLALLAMKTKEISFTLPFAVLLSELVFFSAGAPNFKKFLYLSPVLLLLVIVPLGFIGIDKPIGDIIGDISDATQETDSISRGVYLMTQFSVICTYIRMLFLPIGQNLDHDYPLNEEFFSPSVFLSFVFLLALVAVAVFLLVKSRRHKGANPYALLGAFGILWFFLTLAVESSIIPIRDVINEHRLYLPFFGAAMAICAGVFYLIERYAERSKGFSVTILALVFLFVASVPLGISAHVRNMVWADELTLWTDIVEKSPLKGRAHNNLGLIYHRYERYEDAAREYKLATELKGNFRVAHYNLGNAYSDMGRTDEALEQYIESLRLSPDSVETHYNLGNLYRKTNEPELAIVEFEAAIKFMPDYTEAHNNLGNMYFITGRANDAISEYKIAIGLDKTFAEPHNNMGTAYATGGDLDSALIEFTEAVRLNSEYGDALYNVGFVYHKKGEVDKAVVYYRKALEVEPKNQNALRVMKSLGLI